MEFQPEKESWQSYAERLDHYFIATKVEEDDQKVTALIVANDPSFYTLLKELSFPVNPKTMTFYDVMSTLERHYVGVKNIFKERKLFYSAVLGPNESASEWYRRLKSLAIKCDFGVLLEEVLVDKFVCGFEGKILQSFYEQDESLELLNALKIAQLHETDVDVDNESIEEEEEVESYSSEVEDDQESEIDEQEYEKVSTSETQDTPILGSMLSQGLSMVQQLCTDMFSQQYQQQRRRRIGQHKVSQNHHLGVARQKQKTKETQVNKQQKQGNNQKQEPAKQQKTPQPQKCQKPIQKQNNQQQVKSQHQQPNHKPNNSQKPQKATPMSHSQTKPQQPQQSTSVQKSTNHQQKQQPQKSQTIQKSTTIITKTKTTIKTAAETVTNPKKGPAKCHKCGKVGHNANVCHSK